MSQKNIENYRNKTGICYTDNNNISYTWNDFYLLTRDETLADNIFEEINESSPEDYLTQSWSYQKCYRCGTWDIEKNILNREKHKCKFCTPIRTNGIIPVNKDIFCDDRNIYTKTKAVFKQGITSLIGCNGIGKTTLIHQISRYLKTRGTPYFIYDNLSDDGGQKKALSMLNNALLGRSESSEDDTLTSIGKAINLWTASEGEKIGSAFISFITNLIKDINSNSGYGEYWILIDGLDSGLSYDIIYFIKNTIFKSIIENIQKDMHLYIICSSNSYEMAENTSCFSVYQMKYINVKNYAAFKKSVLRSKKYKDERDEVLDIKYNISKREYKFEINKDAIYKYNNFQYKNITKEAATLIKDNYKLSLIIKVKNSFNQHYFILYKKDVNGNWIKTEIKQFNFNRLYGFLSNDKIENTMHQCVCRQIFVNKEY